MIQRGFTPEEIDSGFRGLSRDDGSWRITTISPEDLTGTYELKDMEKLFRMDSQDGNLGSFPFPDDFEYYSSICKLKDDLMVSAAVLEPFIARLVIACNKCCIFTYMSDDGWHETGNDLPARELIIWMRERYSTLWFWIIAEYVFGEKWPREAPYVKQNWNGIFEPTNEERWLNNRKECGSKVIYRIPIGDEAGAYKKINEYACFLEENHNEFCAIRDKWMSKLRSIMDTCEIDSMKFLDLRPLIIGSVDEDLQLMSKKWRAMQTEMRKRYAEGVQAWDFTGPRYLSVPIEEKDKAKHLGARWDRIKRKWYISWETDEEPFSGWL